MLGNLSGPLLLVILAVVLVVVAVTAIVLIVWAVKRSSRARQQELQRAYEAGLNQPRD